MKFEQRKWDGKAEKIFDDFLVPEEERGALIADINEGFATLWRITGENWETWLITRLERWSTGHREMVLEAVKGRNVVEILKYLFEHYRKAGVDSVRFVTPHPEAVAARLVAPLGMKRVETVFRVEL